MITRATVSGAYGRDYKAAEAAIADFESGKDFLLHSYNDETGHHITDTYCSKRDFTETATVEIRYNKLAHVHIYRRG